MYYSRWIEKALIEDLNHFPVLAILGPRQCGKTTLAIHLTKHFLQKPSVYLDLERPSDLRKLDDAEWFLSQYHDHLICIDEIQRKAELFPLLRSLVDEWKGTGHFLILGSASAELIRQSSESLAGRIAYHRLRPFIFPEIQADYSQDELLIRGGYPRSIFSQSNELSQRWRENFITSFIERDLLQLKSFSPQMMQRLLQMLVHVNGQLANYSSLANSLDLTSGTVKNYIDLLAGAFMIDLIPPFLSNSGKRIRKSPKIYLADTGIVTALLGIRSMPELLGHPALGALWESYVLHHLRVRFPSIRISFYRTAQGSELDFILEYGGKIAAVECKASLSPDLNKGNYISFRDTQAEILLVAAPVTETWRVRESIFVQPLTQILQTLAVFFGLD